MRASEFQQKNPVKLDVSRSRFVMEPRWTGTFSAYSLVPCLTYTDVMPGDTFKLSSSFVIRMATPVCPVMDDLFLDVSFYFVPHELILSRSYMSPSTNDSNHSWKAFIGAQDSFLNMPVPDSSIQLPAMYVYYNSYAVGGIADCMGIPVPASGKSYLVNPLAPLAFMAVWNENYREPNVQNPGVFSISSGIVSITWAAAGAGSGDSVFSNLTLPNVCRFHGFFGSCLPWPQRNNTSVLLPLGTSAPLFTDSSMHSLGTRDLKFGVSSTLTTDDGVPLRLNATTGSSSGEVGVFDSDSGSTGANFLGVRSSNLMVDLANASAVSINTFRLAVQEQRWYEALARGGNRIDELTASLFGVVPHDAGGNQPEYLGGKRIPLQVSQVNVTANSASGSRNTAVGDTGAFSLTADSDYYFTKSFDKWGSIIGVCCVRFRDSFSQSLNPMFTRHERFDWYFPQFANLGEMPVKKHTLSILENTSANDTWPDSPVFGYQEAWADFRTIPDVVTGLVRPGSSLGHWTYANDFDSSGAHVATGATNLSDYLTGVNAYKAIDRTLTVGSGTSGLQFLAQFQHTIVAVRPMPLYSIPGLVDHH